MNTQTATQFVRSARRVATPILAIATLDQRALVGELTRDALKTGHPSLTWDCLRGFVGLNDEGAAAIATITGEDDDADACVDPGEALKLALKLRERSCLFFLNAQRFIQAPDVCQGIMNLRDLFKADQRTLVLVGPGFTFPAEIVQDMAHCEEPLPTDEMYTALARKLVKNANAHRKQGDPKVPMPNDETLSSVVIALRGLAAFPAEQALVMSLTPSGYNLDALWQLKKATMEQIQGLEFSFGEGPALSDVIGLGAITQWIQRAKVGPRRPAAIMFFDEIEKMVAGSSGGGDTSGVSQALMGSFLTWTATRRHKGILLVGAPGVGKSYVVEAMARELSAPCVKVSLSEVKSSYVGASEQNLKTVLKTVDSIASERLLMVATSNRIEALPPELRDRFNVGTWYVDLPSEPAQAEMWDWYTARPEYKGFKKQFGSPPAASHYTGRDIMNITDSAYMQGVSLDEAAKTSNVPVALSQPKVIERLRDEAHKVYLSAHVPGVYHKPDSNEARAEKIGGRRISWDEEEGDTKES